MERVMASTNSTSHPPPANQIKITVPLGFFPECMLAARSVLRTLPDLKLNKRHSWAEAEIFIFAKLRVGYHPDFIFHIITTVTASFPLEQYTYEFLCASVTMLKNLYGNGFFADLPTYVTYDAFMDSEHPFAVEQLCRYKSLMAHRFDTFWVFGRQILDPIVEATLNAAPPMDAWCVQTTTFLRQKYNVFLSSKPVLASIMAVPMKTPIQYTDAPHAGVNPAEPNTSSDLIEFSPDDTAYVTGSEECYTPPLSPMSTNSTTGTLEEVDPFVNSSPKSVVEPDTYILAEPRPIRPFNYRFRLMTPALEEECISIYTRKLRVTRRRMVKDDLDSPSLPPKACGGMLDAFALSLEI